MLRRMPPPLEEYCPTLAGNGISLAGMSGSETRRLRLDLVLQSIRLCPQEFIMSASLFPPSDSPVSAIQGMMNGAGQSTIALAKEAAARIRIEEKESTAAVAKQLVGLLGSQQAASPGSLAELERQDSENLAKMAAGQRVRTGEHQSILVCGLFIMWVANRAALNGAFESFPSSQEWLRPFPPFIVVVMGDRSKDSKDFEMSVVRRAQANDGPIDQWYRGFKIEQ